MLMCLVHQLVNSSVVVDQVVYAHVLDIAFASICFLIGTSHFDMNISFIIGFTVGILIIRIYFVYKLF